MTQAQVNRLLEKYYAGETSVKEEVALKNYFATASVPPQLQEHQSLFRFLEQSAQAKPQIDWEDKFSQVSGKGYNTVITAAIITGLVALLAGGWLYFNTQQPLKTTPDQPEAAERYKDLGDHDPITDRKEKGTAASNHPLSPGVITSKKSSEVEDQPRKQPAMMHTDSLVGSAHAGSDSGLTVIPVKDIYHICPGEVIQLRIHEIPGARYRWEPEQGLHDPTTPHPMADPMQTTTYIVHVMQGERTGTANLTVYVHPLPEVTVANVPQICPGDTVPLRVAAPTATEIKWHPEERLSNPASATPKAFPTTTTTYTVEAYNAHGCKQLKKVPVRVAETPKVSTAEDAYIRLGESTTLQAGTGVSFNWTPVAGLSDTDIPDPVATPQKTTRYVAAITSEQGCVRYDTVTVHVTATVEVPSAFSPNGDGINDVLYVVGKAIKTMHFQIYDVQGRIVFGTEDMEEGWDGTHFRTEEKVPAGIYTYSLKGHMKNGTPFSKRGTIRLIQ